MSIRYFKKLIHSKDSKNIKNLIGALFAPDVRELERKRDLDGLSKVMRYKNCPEASIDAAKAIYSIGGESAVELLCNALLDKEAKNCQVMIARNLCQLSELGTRESLSPKSLELIIKSLIETINHENSHVRSYVYQALGSFRDNRAVDSLIQALGNDCEKSIYAYGTIILALGKIGDPRAIDSVVGFLLSDDPSLFRSAASALKWLGWKPGKSEASVRYYAIIGEWEKCVEIGTAALQPLTNILNSSWSKEDQKASAIKAMGEIGDVNALEDILKAFNFRIQKTTMSSTFKTTTVSIISDKIVREAIIAAGKIGDEKAVDPLTDKLKNSVLDSHKINAAEALKNIGSKKAVVALNEALKHSDFKLRKEAAKALGKIGGTDAINSLFEGLRDQDKDVFTEVSKSIIKLGPVAAQLLRKMIETTKKKLIDEEAYWERSFANVDEQTLEMYDESPGHENYNEHMAKKVALNEEIKLLKEQIKRAEILIDKIR